MSDIKFFETKTQAEQYRRTCVAPCVKGTQVRMFRNPAHKWANRRGNVPAIWCGRDPVGDKYLWDDGTIHYDGMVYRPQ